MYIKVSTGTSFGAAAEYDEKGLSKDQQAAKAGRVEQIATYNLLSTDARGIGFEMSNVAAFSRAEKPVWNVSISAAPGQQLSNQQWQQVAEQYLRGMKADPNLHQIAIWRHHDTDQDHIHVLLNSVPIGGGPALSRQYTGKDARRLATEIDASLTPGLVQQLGKRLTALGRKLSGKETVAKPTGVRVAISQAVTTALATKPTTETELLDSLKAAGVGALLLGNSTSTNGINFVLDAKPHQPIKGSLIKLEGGSTAKWGELARRLDANRQEYEAEIKQLKEERAAAEKAVEQARHELDIERNKPAQQIIRKVKDPAEQEKISRLEIENAKLKKALELQTSATASFVAKFDRDPSPAQIRALRAGKMLSVADIGAVWLSGGEWKSYPLKTSAEDPKNPLVLSPERIAAWRPQWEQHVRDSELSKQSYKCLPPAAYAKWIEKEYRVGHVSGPDGKMCPKELRIAAKPNAPTKDLKPPNRGPKLG
jgi:hypothetical protein